MDFDLLKTFGEIAILGGIALGIFLLLDVIREFRAILPSLKKDDSYRLLRLIIWMVFLVFSITLAGVEITRANFR